MSEYPRPVRLPGEPALPREPYGEARPEPRAVVDDDVDLFGAEEAAARLTLRIERMRAGAAARAADGRALLSPPWDAARDHVDGPRAPRATVVVFGAHGTPASRPLATVLAHVRERYPTSVAVSWRHHPDPLAHPHAVILALATEAAAARGRFWALTRELLRAAHHDPEDLRAAMRRVGLDPASCLAAMRAGTGAERIVDDVASALDSGVTYAPALFVDGERYEGELDPDTVLGALRGP
jgi:DSBA-like thioredoxin domain-containing protein